jgi:hypothetical protein
MHVSSSSDDVHVSSSSTDISREWRDGAKQAAGKRLSTSESGSESERDRGREEGREEGREAASSASSGKVAPLRIVAGSASKPQEDAERVCSRGGKGGEGRREGGRGGGGEGGREGGMEGGREAGREAGMEEGREGGRASFSSSAQRRQVLDSSGLSFGYVVGLYWLCIRSLLPLTHTLFSATTRRPPQGLWV